MAALFFTKKLFIQQHCRGIIAKSPPVAAISGTPRPPRPLPARLHQRSTRPDTGCPYSLPGSRDTS